MRRAVQACGLIGSRIVHPCNARVFSFGQMGFLCENSDFIGQSVSDQAKHGRREFTVRGRPPDTLSAGIKRTAGSHPKERVSGGVP